MPVNRFEAIGTYVFVATRTEAALGPAADLTRTVLEHLDHTCSRFRADSDLARVNRLPGQWVEVDPMLVAAVSLACEVAGSTDGLVNPLLGRQLVALGYDRDFGLLAEVSDLPLPTPPAPDVDAWREIRLDPEGAIRIPSGTALDLGATAKAWAADVVGEALDVDGVPALVSIGGDLRISAPDERAWPVAVGEQPDAAPDQVVDLGSGGLATSSTRVRTWSRAGVRRHHLVDPRTGSSAAEVWTTVTATGATATAANAASTAAIVLGAEASAWLAARRVTARLVAADGQVLRVGTWPEGEPAREAS